MIHTQVANNIGIEDNGCAVVALLSGHAQQHIIDLLAHLASDLEGVIWAMPATSLHTTLCEIIQPKPYAEDKHVIYESNKAKYKEVLSGVLGDYSSIDLRFNQIEVSPQAIIVRAENPGVYNEIRGQLLEKLPFPKQTKLPPDIAHSSIARFIKEVDIETVNSVVARYKVDFTESINEFQLLYPIWPHLLHYEVVDRFPLLYSESTDSNLS